MIDVFLTYSHIDKDVMEQIHEALQRAGFEVWTDRNLEPGTPDWESAIGEAIEDSRTLAVILSPDAKQSPYVKQEIAYAQGRSIKVYPIFARGTEQNAIPIHVFAAQRIDIRTEFDRGIQELITALRKYLGSKEEKKEQIKRDNSRKDFWAKLLEASKGQTTLFSKVAPSQRNYMGTAAGKSGFGYSYVIAPDWASVELYIDVKDKEKNKKFFDQIFAQKEAIEREFGEPISWERLDHGQASRVRAFIRETGGFGTPETWSALQKKMVTAMIRLEKVLGPRIASL